MHLLKLESRDYDDDAGALRSGPMSELLGLGIPGSRGIDSPSCTAHIDIEVCNPHRGASSLWLSIVSASSLYIMGSQELGGTLIGEQGPGRCLAASLKLV